MRSLITAFTFIASSSVFAEPATFGYSYTNSSNKGVTSARASENNDTVGSTTHRLSYSSGLQKNTYRFRFSSDYVDRDLDNYIIIDEQGNESRLSESDDGKEYILSAGADYVYESFTLSLDGSQSVEDSPLKTKSINPGITFNKYDWGFIARYSFLYKEDARPETTVVNPESLRSSQLSTKLTREFHDIELEQIVTEWAKVSSSFRYAKESEDRPSHLSGSFTFLAAPLDELGVFSRYQRVVENEDFLPRDGTGFFSLSSYTVGASYEYNYDYVLKLIYTTTVEKEEARGGTDVQRIGTDAIALGVDGRFKRLLPTLLATYEKSNTNRSAFLISGGLTWEL